MSTRLIVCRSLVIALASLVATTTMGCDWIYGTQIKPGYCQAYPDDPDCPPQPDAPSGCSSNAQCQSPTGVCDVGGSMACVECLPDQAAACTGTSPVCGGDYACRACSTHAECSSGACLPDGSCGTDSNVAYVDPAGTDNATCTKAMPCTKVAKSLATLRPFVKFQGTTDAGTTTITIDNQNVTLIADPGAVLTRSSNGLLLELKGASQVSIYDLEISGASGAQGVGISIPTGSAAQLTLQRATVRNNAGGGISVSGGSLTVSQSTFAGNQGGGISVTMNGTFVIVGNVFFSNGTPTGTVGGISITTSENASNRLEFNSFNTNQAQVAIGAAIQCTAGAFTARNNIMSGNGTLMNMEQVGGGCAHAYSIVRPGTVPNGTGNSGSDPMFKNTTTGDLHIQPTSPARGAADPNSALTGIAARDIDGDPRTVPADIGADEVVP